MYLRLHNSCTYVINHNHFEIRSDVFRVAYKCKGINQEVSESLLVHLQKGITEACLFKHISEKYNISSKSIQKLVKFLRIKDLVVERINIDEKLPEDTLYDRQIRFLDSFETQNQSGYDLNYSLQNKKVVIIGLGAYGTWLALHCARLGIKHILAIDFDTVEISNLHRQILYSMSDIGSLKVDASAKLISSVDSSIKYEGYNRKISSDKDLMPYLDNADLVFNSFGYFNKEEAESTIAGCIAKACITSKVPMLCLSTNWIGPLYIPGKSACYFCISNHPELEIALRKDKRNPRVNKRAFAPLFAMTCSLAALEATRYLSGIDNSQILNAVLTLNPFQMCKSSLVKMSEPTYCKYCSLER